MKKRTIVIIGLALCSNAAWAACNPKIPKSTPTADFTDHKDGTVTHKTTGLMWKICSEGYEYKAGSCAAITGATNEFKWAAALNYVNKLNRTGGFAGYQDWRLPNIKELVSIVEEACVNPAINSKVFPDPSNEPFWSASPYAGYNGYAWDVYFDYGNEIRSYKGNSFRVRLVRTR